MRYPLPTGRSLNVWQADLGGGVRVHDVPLNVTLIRPAMKAMPREDGL